MTNDTTKKSTDAQQTAAAQGTNFGAASRAIAPRLASAGTLIGLIGVIAVFSILKPNVFFTPLNFLNVLEQLAVLAIIAAVQTVVMVVGDFDLSVGALASLVGVVVAQLLVAGWDPVAATVVAIVVGVLAGAINGLLVAYVGLSAFIATLATMTAFSGVALLVSNGATVFGLPTSFVWLGQGRLGPIPVPVVIAILLALVVWVVLSRTTAGRGLYAVGGNPEAAMLSGLNTRRIRFTAFCVAGAGSAIAGVVLTARLASGHPTAADGLMLSSIAAVFLGMTLSRAGYATLGGTAVGLGIVGVLNNGLNILQVNSYVQQVVTGAIIVLAVSLSRLSRRR